MNCSVCGAVVPVGRSSCGTCGAELHPLIPAGGAHSGIDAGPGVISAGEAGVTAGFVHACPRCAYQGPGGSWFSQNKHVARLVVAGILTLPMSFGAGGFIYYALRHNHLICPRCGAGWGKYGGSALPVAGQPYPTASGLVLPVLAEESGSGVQAGSIALGILALLLLVTGVAEGVWVMVVWGVLAGVGAFLLHRASRRARDQRRQALIARLQQDVLRLAGEKRGRLTVTEVASSLAWPMARAEKVLNSLDDGWRVNSTVTDEGMIVYEFLELLRPGDEP